VARFNTAQKFNKKVVEYCDYYNINLEESKYNGVRSFIISRDTPIKKDDFTNDGFI